MNRLAIAVCMLCLAHALFAGQPVAGWNEPQLRIGEAVDYYDVTARNKAELIENMRVPGADTPTHAHGLTRASFTVERKLTQKPDRCVVDSIGVRLDLRITLPRWSPGVEIPQALQVYWDKVLGRVTAHENHHRQNALAAAFAMRDRFSVLAPSQSCAKVEAFLKHEMDAVLLKQRLADQLLDNRTKPAALQAPVDPTAARERPWRVH